LRQTFIPPILWTILWHSHTVRPVGCQGLPPTSTDIRTWQEKSRNFAAAKQFR